MTLSGYKIVLRILIRSLPHFNNTAFEMKNTNKLCAYTPKNDSDDLNPKYLFQGIATDLLVAIVNKQIDTVELANKELQNRGLDENGKWVGFKSK
jgi:hypothetical protein